MKKIYVVGYDFVILKVQLKKRMLKSLFILKPTEVANDLVFLRNVNSFIKFFDRSNSIARSSIFTRRFGLDLSFRLKINYRHPAESLSTEQVNMFTNIYKGRKLQYPDANILNNKYYNYYLFLKNKTDYMQKTILDKFFLKYSSFMRRYYGNKKRHLNNINKILNINFLRKERLYTKLKYSRSPAYDIVSGGAAALLAAFLGFLITEKYGFELLDSGDFYYMFMYFVFFSFSIKPVVLMTNAQESWIQIISINPLIRFYISLLNSFFKTY